MNPRHGKLLARWSVALGLAVLVICAVALRHRIAEEWWLYKLESGDVEAQKVAAERLAELGSVRAIPVLLGILGRVESVVFTVDSPPKSVVHREGIVITDPVTYLELVSGESALLWMASDDYSFFLDALWKITDVAGTVSVPYLVEALDDHGRYGRCLAALLLGRIGSGARPAIPTLTATLQDRNEAVRRAAAIALKQVQRHEASPR